MVKTSSKTKAQTIQKQKRKDKRQSKSKMHTFSSGMRSPFRISLFRSTISMHQHKKISPLKMAKGLLFFAILAFSLVGTANADPTGPTVTLFGNSTKGAVSATKINSTINGTISPGGYVFTSNLNALQQNTRWKAYVGNVTGTLTLDDAQDNTLFQWSLTSVSGEVYATRASSNINWTGINCTWRGELSHGVVRYNESNRTVEERENLALSHTSKDDNITTTFALANHSSITVGARIIGKNECFALNTYQNGDPQTFEDSDNANFTQVILYDGTNTTNGNVLYETKIENDKVGYRSDSTYDFQILLPENGALGFTGSTAYYFYVELT